MLDDGKVGTAQSLSDEPETQTEPAVQEKLYIVDTLTAKPGDAKALLEYYMEVYRPLAEGAGACLVSSRVSPPMWLELESNTLQIVWAIDGIVPSAWILNSATRYNPAYVEWCFAMRKRVVARDRSYFAGEEYMEVLNNV